MGLRQTTLPITMTQLVPICVMMPRRQPPNMDRRRTNKKSSRDLSPISRFEKTSPGYLRVVATIASVKGVSSDNFHKMTTI